MSDRFISFWHMEVAGSASDKEQAPCLSLSFDLAPHRSERSERMGAYHSAEIEYGFGRLSGEFLRCGEAKTAR